MIHRSLLTGYFWKRLEIQRELKEDTCPANHLKYMKNSYNIRFTIYTWGFPGDSDGKESACNVGDPGSIPGLGKSPGEGNGNPLQYSCLENPVNRAAWQATVHGVEKS